MRACGTAAAAEGRAQITPPMAYTAIMIAIIVSITAQWAIMATAAARVGALVSARRARRCTPTVRPNSAKIATHEPVNTPARLTSHTPIANRSAFSPPPVVRL